MIHRRVFSPRLRSTRLGLNLTASLATSLFVSSYAAIVAAQPDGLSSQAPASAGTTNVAKEGFQAPVVAPEDSKDSTTFKLTAGGFLSAGNSRTIAATTAADFFMRRGTSAFTALAAFNYGRSAPGADLPSETTVQNYQASAQALARSRPGATAFKGWTCGSTSIPALLTTSSTRRISGSGRSSATTSSSTCGGKKWWRRPCSIRPSRI
jgi:hypothetical protein